MKTIEQVIEAFQKSKEGYNSLWVRDTCQMLDARDFDRLFIFMPAEHMDLLGFVLKEGYEHKPISLSRENVLQALASDLDFAFEKAIGERGISSSLMHEVILMWLWVLDDELKDFLNYAPYGLPLYQRVAEKYELPDPSKNSPLQELDKPGGISPSPTSVRQAAVNLHKAEVSNEHPET